MNTEFLEVRQITKYYGVVQALKGVSFSFREGEVHTLLGENGAGKSTLIKIISGEETPTSGQIILEGKPITLYNPRNAMSHGIAMVHQELAIFENVTVAENIFPNCDNFCRSGIIDRKKMYAAADEKIKLFGMDVQPIQKMDSLTLAQQQMVEILRCISAGQKIILLDEPTSGLNADETKKLMAIIAQLKAGGITIIYISHRINEILDVSDRITVLKDGTYVGTYDNDQNISEIFLIGKMVGRELTESLYQAKTDRSSISDEVVFEVKNLGKAKSAKNIDFSLRKGEVLGFFGLEGSGTNAVSRMIYGLEAADTGEIFFHGQKIQHLSPQNMVKRRIMYLNNNRKTAGLLLDSPALFNISIPLLKELSDGLFLNTRRMVSYTMKFVSKFNIVIPSVYQLPRNLSGGNQQKLMLSMCLTRDPQILIINEPTRGIDVGSKAEIHKYILELVKSGISVIIFSSEMPELISLADRIIVMHENHIIAELGQADMSEEIIMAAASGV